MVRVMARKSSLNVDSLTQLGVEKLARLVLDEAERSAPFRKLVNAALAGTKGPEAVAKLIDRRLLALERARSFIEREKTKTFGEDLSATVSTITRELASAAPTMAIDRLLRFVTTHESVFDRVDDSYGRVQDVYYTAINQMGELAPQLTDDEKGLLPGKIMAALGESTHGYLVHVPEAVAQHLPEGALRVWDKQLAASRNALQKKVGGQHDWYQQSRAGQVRSARQAIANARGDLDGLIALESTKPSNSQDTIGIAERLLEADRLQEALDWVRKEMRSTILYMSATDLADGSAPRDFKWLRRSELEARILESIGDKPAAQSLRWKTFEATLSAQMLRDYIGGLGDFEEFEALDRAFDHAFEAKQRYQALKFFLEWPRLDHAATLVLNNHREWGGQHYDILGPAAETLEHDHPVAATVRYRALLDDILDRAKSNAYGYGGRYLARLDSLAPLAVAGLRQAGIDSHVTYRIILQKKHGRKAGFWAVAPKQ
jgi:hypothetical protein